MANLSEESPAGIAGMDFLTVITANIRMSYCLFLIRHHRREVTHLNVTEPPRANGWATTSRSISRKQGQSNT